MKTIIMADRPGQMGNLLVLYAHFLAYCFENDCRLVNPAFTPYESFFSFNSSSFDKLNFGPQVLRSYDFTHFLMKVLRKMKVKNSWVGVHSIGYDTELNLDDWVVPSQLNFISGWKFRGYANVEKHKSEIRKTFGLAEGPERELDEFFEQKVDQAKRRVGVHIRRGDYKDFEGGRHFHSNEIYAAHMAAFIAAWGEDSVQFILCSNEEIDESAFDTFDFVHGPGSAVTDMYALSRCDAVLGPPSTFTIWGNFMTDVPVLTVGLQPMEVFSQSIEKIEIR